MFPRSQEEYQPKEPISAMPQADAAYRDSVSWQFLDDGKKSQIRDRFAREALQYLFDRESIPEDSAVNHPDTWVAAVSLTSHPFSGMSAYVKPSGALYCLIAAAHYLKDFFDCSIESAILLCMANDLPSAQPPSDITLSALRTVLTQYSAPTNVFEIVTQYPDLPWRDIRKTLIAQLAHDVRSLTVATKGFDPGPSPTLDLYPRFCASEAECKARLTRAALSLARLLIDTEPANGASSSAISWKTEPELLHLLAELESVDPAPRIHFGIDGDRTSIKIRLAAGITVTLSRGLKVVQHGTDDPPTREQWLAAGRPATVEDWVKAGQRNGRPVRLPAQIWWPWNQDENRPAKLKLDLTFSGSVPMRANKSEHISFPMNCEISMIETSEDSSQLN